MMDAYTLYGTFETYLAVRYAYDLLVEYALDAFACDVELRTEFVAAA